MEKQITTRKQAPIGSGFDKSSTASKVLEGLDLKGRTAIITGGHSGLGLESTKALVKAGVDVIVGARNTTKAREALKGIDNTTIIELDLSDLNSVAAFSESIANLNAKLDIFICNAGIMACPETRIGDGWESQFATNHLGHFVLVNLLWEQLNDGARVVCVSSAGHHNSPIRWDDIHFNKDSYDKWAAYGQSKTANALFALQLDEYGKERGVRAFSLHPGKIRTPLQRHLTISEMVDAGWIDENDMVVDPEFKSPEQGAATQVWAATSPKLNGLGGLYCEDCEIAGVATADSTDFIGVREYATSLKEAVRLWELSAKLTKVNAFG